MEASWAGPEVGLSKLALLAGQAALEALSAWGCLADTAWLMEPAVAHDEVAAAVEAAAALELPWGTAIYCPWPQSHSATGRRQLHPYS